MLGNIKRFFLSHPNGSLFILGVLLIVLPFGPEIGIALSVERVRSREVEPSSLDLAIYSWFPAEGWKILIVAHKAAIIAGITLMCISPLGLLKPQDI